MITSQHARALIFAAAILGFAVVLDAVPMFAQAQSTAASEAAMATAKAKLEAATAAQNAGKKKFPVTREDMVVAMPVDQAHLTIAHASRVWRKVLIFPVTAASFWQVVVALPVFPCASPLNFTAYAALLSCY